ncbi:MAG: hypothetical protein KIT34_05260 [Cyanobacteria bacterium TGS_CYA1]|nr:hypothetical protein [Cyanobacteria bacterium TGS_CYA1]
MSTHVMKIKILTSGFLIALSAAPCFAQTATISDLWFIRGNWKADLGPHEYVKEQWKRADDKTLTGESVFIEETLEAKRELTKESLTISETEKGLVLRIKHTDKDGKPWEESKETGDMNLVEYDLTHAVFDNQKENDRVKITYTWIEENQMKACVEVTKAKKPKVLEFQYRRVADSSR